MFMENKEKNSLFEKIYAADFSYVYNYIYMKVLHKETAEEICSEVFFRAYRAIETYDPEKAGERTWLCAIAHNLVINYYKSSAAKKTGSIEEAPEIPIEDNYGFSRQAANREVERLFTFLNEEEREILSLRFGMELSVKEIAALNNISQNAMTHRITRILEKLRKIEEKSGYSLSDFTG